ncbi:MAG: inositol monophosphatase [Acidobacteria bacterium]|nr:inositol monophosphatase [Thermoanaerobaculia bacterium]MDI9631189.1 inositol monophosphatase family protein [Acidobacteriota bacterium]MBP7812127.1 inositol monophosphatase [Thermoanaerobaculia bacterium]MBP8844913.1 inositol monophosphatase [Thermoanaerobaculia bacterium]NLN10547.1 inositol monophosphatase [Acidobacteriota bacterium]
MPYVELLAAATAAAEAGAAVLRHHFRRAGLLVEEKAKNDYVTEADRESERTVTSELRSRFPDHRIVGEEGGSSGGRGAAGELTWLIDPLDGTTNFVQGLPIFAVSIACLEGNRPVAGVILDPVGRHLFRATRGGGAFLDGERLAVSARRGLDGSFLATGYPFRALGALDLYLGIFRDALRQARAIRRCGAAALDLAYTAAGVYDGFFELRLSAWDIAAGALLVEEAGGAVSDFDGGDGYLASGNVLAGGIPVHRELLALIHGHASEERVARLAR